MVRVTDPGNNQMVWPSDIDIEETLANSSIASSDEITPQAKSEDIYFEAGAMRIPRSSLHLKISNLIRYLNTHCSAKENVELIPHILEHKRNISFFEDKKGSLQDTSSSSRAGVREGLYDKAPQEPLGSIVPPWLTLLR